MNLGQLSGTDAIGEACIRCYLNAKSEFILAATGQEFGPPTPNIRNAPLVPA